MSERKKLLIAGGTGLIGKRLVEMLDPAQYEIGILSRSHRSDGNITYHQWDVEEGVIDDEVLQYDYLINLAGAGIADKPWTSKRKEIILKSRTDSTGLLKSKFEIENKKLKGIVNASAIGYYGDSTDQILTEESDPNTDEFLVQVCKEWERAASELVSITDHLAIIRIGTVLTKNGGALPKMADPIKFGVANYLGSGKQWMSWIHIDDISKAILFLLENEMSGIFNGSSPNPVQNKVFTKILRKHVNRFSILLPAPEKIVRIAFGELANLVFNSNRVSSKKIENAGFQFEYPDLHSALTNIFSLQT